MPVFDLFAGSPMAFALAALLLGLVIGSFLNVVIHRLPLMMEREWRSQCQELLQPDVAEKEQQAPLSLVSPRSRCPDCGHLISALENIPVLSYLIQRGRCRHCGGRISVRYPLVELATGLLTALVAWQFGFGWEALAAMGLTWALIALTFIDFDTQLLPDDITLPFLWLGIGLAFFGLFTDLHASVVGAMAGYLTLWAVYHLFKLVTGKEGMGYGDFKLLGMLGAWLGWQALPVIILLSSVVGAVVGISLILFRNHGRDVPIPFGPYLAAAGWLALMWGDELTNTWLRLFAA